MGPDAELSAPTRSNGAPRAADAQQALVHAALLFVGSYLFGALIALTLGPVTGSQLGMLAHLAGQQILVVGGLSALWITRSGLGAAGALGHTTAALPWLGVVVALSGALVLLQVPALDAWTGALGLEPPTWYGVALKLDGPWRTLAVFVVVAAVPAVCEELFFRGYLLGRLKALPPLTAVGLQALLFALYHIDLYGLPIYLASGMIFGAVRLWSGALWPVIVLHAANNAVGITDIDRGEPLYHALGVWGPIGGLLLAGAAALGIWALTRQPGRKV